MKSRSAFCAQGQAMMESSIIHVLSSGRRRGAEIYAVELAQELSAHLGSQNFVILRDEGRELEFPEGCDVTVARWKWLSFLPGFRDLRAVIRAEGPGAFVIAHGYIAARVAVAASLGLRSPPKIILQKIGFTEPWLRRGAWARVALARLVISRVAASIALGKGQAAELVGLLRADPTRVHFLPNGRSLPVFDNTITRQEDIVLMVGSLTAEKRPEVTIRLLKALAQRGVEARLRYVGDGPLRRALEADIKRQGLSGRVTFTGRVDDVWPHYREASMLVICSATEGTPGVAIEAAIAGLPVICWNVGDVASVVVDGVTGYVVPYGDEDALLAKAQTLFEDLELRSKMSVEAHEVGRLYNIRPIARKFLDILEQVRGN